MIGFSGFIITDSSALECKTVTNLEHANYSDLIVRGTVISEKTESTSKFVDFNVKEWFKGTSANTLAVRSDTTWGPSPLYKGYEYIVFLKEHDDYYDLPVCTPVYFALPSIIEGVKTINDPLSSFANLFGYEVEERLPESERNELLIISKEIQNLSSGIPLSPAKQIAKGIPLHEIQCKQGLELIIKESDDSPACVKEQSVIPLMIREWAKISEFEVSSGFLKHTITNGKVISMHFNGDHCSPSLIVQINSENQGSLNISVPRIFVNPTDGQEDDNFVVIVDGKEADFKEFSKDSKQRTLEIPFSNDSKNIEIIKTCLI